MNTVGGSYAWGRVYVIDHPESEAADPTGALFGEAGSPFTDEERHIIEEAVADVTDVRWISSDEELDPNGAIPEDSAVVTLGPLVRTGEPNSESGEVGVGMRCGSTCGLWLTYTLAETADGWRVTGNLPQVTVS
ncbi:MAG: hypothetical protein M5U31_15255 [Acidimicrobiia bacterium]|nr:hypothetical protein [Acidimicrobiia bacterium]